MVDKRELENFVPENCQYLLSKNNTELRSAIPELARDWMKMMEIESTVESLPSDHRFHQANARNIASDTSSSGSIIEDESIHLVVTSPPYFNIKEYNDTEDQLGSVQNFDEFSEKIKDVWQNCYDKLIPGGRMCIVTGDILQSRREAGRHRVLPLHARIQEQCSEIGFDCLSPIIWNKIGNAALEAGGNARFLGKPYEPGAVVKNDIEYILLFKKPGDYRSPSVAERILSTIQVDYHRKCFQQIWTDIRGENRSDHPAPYPEELAERLIRMFSFVGDTVLDPFAGVGTTAVAASRTARDSINIEIDPEYISRARDRLSESYSERNYDSARLSDF
jgi:DNA modification methylase